jgi:tetratricopeptide (TPR) repeat protein
MGAEREQPAPDASRFTHHPSLFYGLALVLFIGALLAKTTAFSLPAVILLLAWWRRGRLNWRADVLPTLPFFVLSVGMCVMTAWVEKTHVGAHGPEFDLSLTQRCLVAGRVFWFYLGKLFWPAHLCFVYPRWQPDPSVWWQWLYPVAAVGLLLGLWLARNRIGRGPVTAAFFYVGTLLPLLGFVSAYAMRYSFVWNHWVYLPSLGPLVLVAAGLELARRRASLFHLPSSILHLPSSIFCLLLPVLGVLTWHEAGQYADIETLWRSTLARNPDCWMAHGNLGMALAAQGKLADAMQQYDAALTLNPNYVEAHVNRGNLLTRQGKIREAIAEYDRALEIKPTNVDAHYGLGNALVQQGKPADAIQQYERALELDPNNTQVEANMGSTLAQQGKLPEAIQHFQRAIQLDPNQPGVHLNLGNALAASGHLPEAIQNFEQELQMNPDFAQAHVSLGTALATQGNLGDALQHFQRALEINPNFAEARYYSGLALASLGKGSDAISQLQQAAELATAQGNARLAQAARQRLQVLQPALPQAPAR